jgi:hypothetical protein
MKELVTSTSMNNMMEEFINPDGWARQQKILSGRILAIAECARSEYKTVDVPKGYIDFEGLHI